MLDVLFDAKPELRVQYQLKSKRAGLARRNGGWFTARPLICALGKTAFNPFHL